VTDRTSDASPGWYPDPWGTGQRRFWSGERWTADTIDDRPDRPDWADRPDLAADEPVSPWAPPGAPVAPAAPLPWSTGQPGQGAAGAGAGAQPWTPTWTYPTTDYTQYRDPSAPPPAPEPPRPNRLVPTIALVVGLIVGFVVVVAIVAAVTSNSGSKHTAAPLTIPPPTLAPVTPPTSGGTEPGPTAPAGPADPAASVLAGLVVKQADVASAAIVRPIPSGDQVDGQTTLDLCNGTFASEALRTARLQVAAIDPQSTVALSTEAVLYSNSSATAQGFAELRSTSAKCPATPVVSPVGSPTVITQFKGAPDSAWPQTATVERLAFDFVTTDDTGQTQHSIAVYLRRGRVLMGVYFAQPDGPQVAVAGQTSIPAIVTVFATRLAQLPASVVTGTA
jgi:hypothetical protein